MGKKRKLPGQPHGEDGPSEVDPGHARLAPINTYEDVADSEDEFHINRDKISLDGGRAQKRARTGHDEEDLELSDEEVLAFSSGSEEEDDDDYHRVTKAEKKGRKGPSLRTSSDGEEGDVEQDAGWGPSKSDYYDADEIENEADALEEEAEARRLQQKRLRELSEADFGFDETEWLDAKEDGKVQAEEEDDIGTVTEVLPQLEITSAMGTEERLSILKGHYPEFEPLAKEFLDLQPLQSELGFGAAASQTAAIHKQSPQSNISINGHNSDIQATPSVTILKHQALNAYLGALSMYFALLTSPSKHSQGTAIAMPASELRSHALMESLVKCRELWNKVRSLPEPQDVLQTSVPPAIMSREAIGPHKSKLIGDITDGRSRGPEHLKKEKKNKQQLALEAAQKESQERRAKRMRENEKHLASLNSLMRPSKRQPPNQSAQVSTTIPELHNGTAHEGDSDFGEELHLSAHEAAEKARRKKSLRFYTSQITQKTQKRDQAGKDAGGDVDVPHRERFKDRQARLNASAEKRGKGDAVASRRDSSIHDLGGDSDSGSANGVQADGDADAVAYYNTIASKPNRAQKRASLNQPPGNISFDANNPNLAQVDGKRGLSYAIATNKGLTPKRKKEVRNPRVKKRVKFAQKQKKLGSVRQVYRGEGEGKGGYGGEKTGIKSGLVRSRKL
ncbi:MAG: hypothetical protein M1837_004940 [Sclerophora amabilis]|nr:MAG: hypothetical protein M1837_004940 [Sclerophora amabilis]